MSVQSVYESPRLWSWWSAGNLVAGTYEDRGPRDNDWLDSNAPTPVANWHSLGITAASFNGTSNYVAANHYAPIGCFSVVVLGEMDSGWPSGDNVVRAFVAGQNGSGFNTVFCCSGINRKLRADSQGTSTAQTAAVTLGTPAIFTFVYDPINKEQACRVNGGTWTTVATTINAFAPRKEYQIGAYGGNGFTRAGFYRSTLAEVLIYSCSLKDTRHSSLLIDAEGTLAAMAGITLP